MSIRSITEQILACKTFAVTGVSRDPEKYGYKVFKSLQAAGFTVYPVNPNADSIDGVECYPSLYNVPGPVDCLVTVTPPAITEDSIRAAGHVRIPFIWMQPGSKSVSGYNLAQSFAMEIVSGGPCIMVAIAVRRALAGAS